MGSIRFDDVARRIVVQTARAVGAGATESRAYFFFAGGIRSKCSVLDAFSLYGTPLDRK